MVSWYANDAICKTTSLNIFYLNIFISILILQPFTKVRLYIYTRITTSNKSAIFKQMLIINEGEAAK